MLSRIVEEGKNHPGDVNGHTVNLHHKQTLENTEWSLEGNLGNGSLFDGSMSELCTSTSQTDKIDKNQYFDNNSTLLNMAEQGNHHKAYKSVTFSNPPDLSPSHAITMTHNTSPLSNSSLPSLTPLSNNILSPLSPLSNNTLPSLSTSQCIASTGETSYELLSTNNGVSLFVPGPHKTIHTTKETQSENNRTMRATQTPTEEDPSSNVSSLSHQKLQSKVEALLLSNELLNTSLDDARRQVLSLQATVVSQREEITIKESQINTINGRVSALLRGMESTDSDNMQYKELYHKSVQQNTILQEQLNKYTRISTNIYTYLNRFEDMSKQFVNNKDLINQWKTGLEQRERQCLDKVKEVCLLKSAHQDMIKDCHKLRESNSILLAKHNTLITDLVKGTVKTAITTATIRVLAEDALRMKDSLTRENYDLHGKIAHLLDSFKHSEEEFRENSEFSSIERQMLLETNQELENDIKTLKTELIDGEEQFLKLIEYIKQYQQESTDKVDVLKTNLTKANMEIEELDKLVEQVRQVLSDNVACISSSLSLLALLQTLNCKDSS